MRSQIWKQMVWVFCLLFLMESCVKHDIYQGEDPSVDPQEPTKEEEDYIAQFENFENIQVNISSQHEGTLYSIYYEYPYEEGSLVKVRDLAEDAYRPRQGWCLHLPGQRSDAAVQVRRDSGERSARLRGSEAPARRPHGLG